MAFARPRFLSMRGMLSFRVLCHLEGGGKCGSEIAGAIEKATGRRPSPGTVYPVLKKLAGRDFIRGRRAGREVCYELTRKGEKELEAAKRFFMSCFSELMKPVMERGG